MNVYNKKETLEEGESFALILYINGDTPIFVTKIEEQEPQEGEGDGNGDFYDLNTRIKNVTVKTLLLDFNPLANFIFNMRNVLIYKTSPVGFWTLIWFVVGLLLCALGIRTIYKYENTYVKVMK